MSMSNFCEHQLEPAPAVEMRTEESNAVVAKIGRPYCGQNELRYT